MHVGKGHPSWSPRDDPLLQAGESRGFTYVWVLAAIALLSIGLAAMGPRWADAAKREREQELLRVGSLYAGAITTYYAAAPGSFRQYPPELKDLLEDTRRVGTLRHVRKLYADPLAPARPWGLVRSADGGITAVFSQSEDAPLHAAPLEINVAVLSPARRYSDWKFGPKVKQ